MKYQLRIYYNSYYLDEKDILKMGPFPTLDEAIAQAREIVRRNMHRFSKAGRKAHDIYTMWTIYGENPVICEVSDGRPISGFNASDFALEVAEEYVMRKPVRGRPAKSARPFYNERL
jgi:hypothetical protein